MDGRNIVMNFSHAYEENRFMRSPAFEWMDCSSLGGTNCYLDGAAATVLRKRLSAHGCGGTHWIDSGDYHYMTKLWTDMATEPFTLVVFDHHPDMQRPLFPEMLSCGSWLRAVLEDNRLLERAYLLGVADALTGECAGFEDRLHVVPESEILHAAVPDWGAEQAIYLSVDKDVFGRDETVTNWDQGILSMGRFREFVDTLADCRIIGVDICGEDAAAAANNIDDKLKNEAFNERLYGLIRDKLIKK